MLKAGSPAREQLKETAKKTRHPMASTHKLKLFWGETSDVSMKLRGNPIWWRRHRVLWCWKWRILSFLPWSLSCPAPPAGPTVGHTSPAYTFSPLDLSITPGHLEWSLLSEKMLGVSLQLSSERLPNPRDFHVRDRIVFAHLGCFWPNLLVVFSLLSCGGVASLISTEQWIKW